jgi:hypothetical protein
MVSLLLADRYIAGSMRHSGAQLCRIQLYPVQLFKQAAPLRICTVGGYKRWCAELFCCCRLVVTCWLAWLTPGACCTQIFFVL